MTTDRLTGDNDVKSLAASQSKGWSHRSLREICAESLDPPYLLIFTRTTTQYLLLSTTMDPLSLPIRIRDAKQSELDVLGQLHASVLANDELWKILWDKVDPEIRNEYIWKGVVSDGVKRGTDAVRVLERMDTSETIGVIWFSIAIKHKQNNKEAQRMKPEGFNHEDLQKVMGPTRKWQEELLQRYGGYLCESSSAFLLKRRVLISCDRRC
jgi:hypothetical protein